MSNIFSRLNKALENSAYYESDPADHAGREAEYKVRRNLSKRIKGSGWRIDGSLRVPDWRSKSRREFDFVITSPDRVIVIELKNWSGEIYMDGHDLIQKRRFNNGLINHRYVFLDLEERVRILKSYSCVRNEANPPFEHIVVFYNLNLEIPDEIRERGDVMTYNELLRFMPDDGGDIKINRSITFYVLKAIMLALGLGDFESENSTSNRSQKRPTNDIDNIRNVLDELGTWDVIQMHGDEVIFGDILSEYRSISAGGVDLVDRAEIESIDMDVDRSLIGALFSEPKAHAYVYFRNGQSVRKEVSGDEEVHYQAAGSPEAEVIQLRHIERVEFGYSVRPKFRMDWSLLKVEKTYSGVVTGVTDFGIFADIGAPTDGLIHVSKLPESVSPESYKKNDLIEVRVISIDEDRDRISFVLDE